jgi:hypothetical protein
MVIDGSDRHNEVSGDLAVGHPSDGELGNLSLARGERHGQIWKIKRWCADLAALEELP